MSNGMRFIEDLKFLTYAGKDEVVTNRFLCAEVIACKQTQKATYIQKAPANFRQWAILVMHTKHIFHQPIFQFTTQNIIF